MMSSPVTFALAIAMVDEMPCINARDLCGRTYLFEANTTG